MNFRHIRQEVERARTRADRAREEHAAVTNSRVEAEAERTRLSGQLMRAARLDRIRSERIGFAVARNWRP